MWWFAGAHGWLLLAAVAQPVAAATAPYAALPASLARAAAAYDRAQAAGDKAALERLLAADYRLVNGAGEVETKNQLIADFTDPGFHLAPYVVEQPLIRTWGGTAVLAGEVHLHGTSGGKPFETHTRFVDVWRLSAGRWQVVYTQVTRMPPGA